MNNLTIYECDDIIKTIESKAREEDGEISAEDIQVIVEAQTTSVEKLGKLVNYISFLNQFCDTADNEMKRIGERKRITKNRLESIKTYLIPYVQQRNGITVGTHRLSIRTSKAIVLADGFNNPMYCNTKTEIVPDKPKIKESIESGIEVQGAVLENRVHLQVK